MAQDGGGAGRQSLAALIGVRQSDAAGETARRMRDKPRVVFTVNHALVVILLLIAALGVSLTMLVQQSMNLAALSGAGGVADISAEMAGNGDATSGRTQDDVREGASGDGTERSSDADAAGAGSADANDAGDAANGESDAGAAGESVGGGATSGTSGEEGMPTNADANAGAGTTDSVDDGRIDLNTATAEQLQTINGIGPVTADRILAHRRSIGRFTSVDQLLDVKGIGSKTLEKIRGQVTVR
ncbi:ComEA family DNA-binding protein [Bifidobacterium sp. UTBIF-78]|uniref:ComEA family DNA-binding protein n=1 Tax=Bifidobacterium sp. UTBIF-78 TaxID=1465263 RepID=UPI0035BEF518